ncbi:MAG: tryptophan--tRNA ligase [Armatimonadota bacterium]|nr:tryptophan--tRNA ligase [Armatimonadota bacterium]MDW8156448.1 tryptophan--tRNA ligase [Armatimonadota bacterium]
MEQVKTQAEPTATVAAVPRVFSGIQPTGLIHLGNYVGALRQWVELQRQYDSYFCIVDLHAITVPYEPSELQQRILEAAAANLAAGIDPERSVLFVQSHVPEHTELMWLLNTITPVGQLERMTQYKDKARRSKHGVMAGLLNYPVLQAADVLLYKATLVPVGEDQVQHIELMRDIAERFNKTFGDTFPLPEARLSRGARIMALNDPTKKMSKSVPGSYIALTEDPEEIRRKVRAAVTDPGPPARGARLEDASPGVANLFTLLEVFCPEEHPRFAHAYTEGVIRYSELKQVLADALVEALAPIRERYRRLVAHPQEVWDVLRQGAERARPVAQATMEEVRRRMGLRAA